MARVGAARAIRRWRTSRSGDHFIEKDIEKDPDAAQEMNGKLNRAGLRGGSIPVLDVRGRIFVGFDPQTVEEALGKPIQAASPEERLSARSETPSRSPRCPPAPGTGASPARRCASYPYHVPPRTTRFGPVAAPVVVLGGEIARPLPDVPGHVQEPERARAGRVRLDRARAPALHHPEVARLARPSRAAARGGRFPTGSAARPCRAPRTPTPPRSEGEPRAHAQKALA